MAASRRDRQRYRAVGRTARFKWAVVLDFLWPASLWAGFDRYRSPAWHNCYGECVLHASRSVGRLSDVALSGLGCLCLGAQFFSLVIELTVLRPALYAAIVVLLLFAALAVFSPLTLLNMLAWSDVNSSVVKNLAYGNDVRQKLDIYLPAQSDVAPNVVIFFYGGNWNSGSRGQYGFVGKALASRGIMTVVADYRLSPQVAYPTFVEDAAQAVSWTLKHIGEYGGNADNVFVAGHSAGAYNAAMVALDPRWLAKFDTSPAALRGWIGIAGPYDFLPIVADSIKPAFLYPDTPLNSQPIRHVTAAVPPTLLITGTADTVVDPVRNSAALAADLRAVHVPVQTISLQGVGHGMLVGAFAPLLRSFFPVLDDVSAFVSRTSANVDIAVSIGFPSTCFYGRCGNPF